MLALLGCDDTVGGLVVRKPYVKKSHGRKLHVRKPHVVKPYVRKSCAAATIHCDTFANVVGGPPSLTNRKPYVWPVGNKAACRTNFLLRCHGG
ncbi:unnamed protein product [Brugia pahangi]|uniref:Secreted protein n=1 Tax=Brugia pahangi TaxID=6280 RepID=A0A0N4SXZ2_BRUPA|nr:unnamed protein product [Brugia pahangi]